MVRAWCDRIVDEFHAHGVMVPPPQQLLENLIALAVPKGHLLAPHAEAFALNLRAVAWMAGLPFYVGASILQQHKYAMFSIGVKIQRGVHEMADDDPELEAAELAAKEAAARLMKEHPLDFDQVMATAKPFVKDVQESVSALLLHSLVGVWTGYSAAGLYDARTTEPLLPLPPNTRPLALSPDGRHLATSVNSRRVQLWDLREARNQLRAIGLDWPAAESATPSAK